MYMTWCFSLHRCMAHVQSARAVNRDVAGAGVGSGTGRAAPRSRRKNAGWTRARWEPATTPKA